ncbi:hypothetical protein THTE_3310 [Thermogutta terrifontis]|uniref:Uncharacterized protein n=1 Tax=Thermogutta terrifontis TaxID=1331910 RepID=A0A286RJ24_9BACT|nr:hypothetical protein THTE_3310 [Thermogutta terrifontis]
MASGKIALSDGRTPVFKKSTSEAILALFWKIHKPKTIRAKHAKEEKQYSCTIREI